MNKKTFIFVAVLLISGSIAYSENKHSASNPADFMSAFKNCSEYKSVDEIEIDGVSSKVTKNIIGWDGYTCKYQEIVARENPMLFYDVLPYAYVLGVSDVYMKKFEGIPLQSPTWIVADNALSLYMTIYLMNRSMATLGVMVGRTMVSAIVKEVAKIAVATTISNIGDGDGGFSGGGAGGAGAFPVLFRLHRDVRHFLAAIGKAAEGIRPPLGFGRNPQAVVGHGDW